MKSRRRPFSPGTPTHVYQRTKYGFLLFYNFMDHLVHFTTMCIVAKRYDIQVLSFCQMQDHIHGDFISSDRQSQASFMRDLSMWYAKYGQTTQCRDGEIFSKHYGSAPKKHDKQIRTNLIYIGNNPVERKLVKNAEEYRWNYLAYANSEYPFSEPLIIRKASGAMKKAIDEVKSTHHNDQPLSYGLLKRLFAKLNSIETHQLIDYIVVTYSVIDYSAAIRYFDSYEKMIGAMHYSTGSEYDIKETTSGRSDRCFSDIANWLMHNLQLKEIHDVFLLPEEKRTDLMFTIHKATGIEPRMIAKYLRVKIE